MKPPAWWPWVSRKRLERAHLDIHGLDQTLQGVGALATERTRERDEARAEVERLRKFIGDTWVRIDSGHDAITDALTSVWREKESWFDES